MDSQIMLELSTLAQKALFVAVVAVVALVVQRVVLRFVRTAFEKANLPNASIIINILRVTIWAVAFLTILQPVFGIDPSTLIATLGVVSVAISLGMQDTISNIVSGLGLMLSGSVKPGDIVEIGSTRGVVTDMTWRSTTLRTRGGNVDVIPNSVLNKTTLTHLDPFNEGMCTVGIAVKPGADLDAVIQDVVDAMEQEFGDDLNPAYGVNVFFDSITAYGTTGSVYLHLVDGLTYAPAQTRAVRALHGRPWCASAVNE